MCMPEIWKMLITKHFSMAWFQGRSYLLNQETPFFVVKLPTRWHEHVASQIDPCPRTDWPLFLKAKKITISKKITSRFQRILSSCLLYGLGRINYKLELGAGTEKFQPLKFSRTHFTLRRNRKEIRWFGATSLRAQT